MLLRRKRIVDNKFQNSRTPSNSPIMANIETYKACIEKGKRLVERLETFEWTDPGYGVLEELYDFEEGPVRYTDPITKDALSTNFQADAGMMRYVEIRPKGYRGDDATYSNPRRRRDN